MSEQYPILRSKKLYPLGYSSSLSELNNIISQDSDDSNICFESSEYIINIHFEDDSGI